MLKIVSALRKCSLALGLFIFIVLPSEPAFAASGSSSPSSSSGSGSSSGSTQGPKVPTGPSADTYTYNSTTGLWQNQYYSWNPATGQTAPLTPQTYSYNPATGMWDTTEWVFDAASGQYVPNTVSVQTPPAGAPTTGSPDDSSSSGNSNNQSPTNSPEDSSNSSTGPNSNNNINNDSNNNSIFDLFNNASISNTLNSDASSGNAGVTFNTTGGSAASGDAQSMATILNLLQSAGDLDNGSLATFVDNIYGNVQGNINLDPSTLAANQVGPNSTNTDGSNGNTNLEVNAVNNGQINNNVNLAANSGNAEVSSNTTAGNATSGDASAVADLVNMIDSMANSGQSFLGTINIYGNLNGDVLLPTGFLDSLLASNSSNIPTTTVNTDQPTDNTTNIDTNTTNNQAIDNNLNLGATSGNATVGDNTTGGNATTGSANTKLTVLNLTGQQVVGQNDLLVFVNVLGTWVGMIVDAPPGATAAELGGGITQDTTNSPSGGNTNVDANATNNFGITNNINAQAASGNADVSDNTTAGNATSGDASASANLANIIDSQFSLSGWLGILFINVFGNWTGSLGMATPAVAPTTGSTGGSGGPSLYQNVKVFKLEPTSSGQVKVTALNTTGQTGNGSTQNNQAVLGASTNFKPPSLSQPSSHQFAWVAAFTSSAVCLLLVGAAEWLSKDHRLRLARLKTQIIRPTWFL